MMRFVPSMPHLSLTHSLTFYNSQARKESTSHTHKDMMMLMNELYKKKIIKIQEKEI